MPFNMKIHLTPLLWNFDFYLRSLRAGDLERPSAVKLPCSSQMLFPKDQPATKTNDRHAVAPQYIGVMKDVLACQIDWQATLPSLSPPFSLVQRPITPATALS
jgi:hypothetical protein